jgi:2-iminobutanoate/2-iminopropanoate deaminase
MSMCCPLIRGVDGFVKIEFAFERAGERRRGGRRGMKRMADKTGVLIEHLDGSAMQNSRSYSPAIVTKGGRTVWLAGQTATVDLEGKSIVNDFEAQVRTCFEMIGSTLRRVGGDLENLVTMTVFINDPRYGDDFVRIRKEIFAEGKYPCSALLTISGFARPGMLVEIQGVAVLPD